MTGSTLRGGIIGCGFFSQFQVEAWKRMPGVELSAACDLEIGRARAVASRAYTSPAEMFDNEELDFVDIATGPESHLELVRLAANRGIPIICQKPMAPDWEQCLEMVQVTERAGVPFMIHENWRWQPWYRAVAKIISTGRIGTPLAYGFRTCKRDGIGSQPYPDQPYFRTMPRLLIYETLVHHLDTARFLFGDVLRVYAEIRRRNPSIAGEDHALLSISHASVLGFVEGHRFLDTSPPGPVMGEAWFEGDEGRLLLNPSGDLRVGSETVWSNHTVDGYRGDSVYQTQNHFIHCLRNGNAPESAGREYLKTVALVEAAYKSADVGCAVAPMQPSDGLKR